ncbi:hypothetical protein [Acetivibrio thermocellus]|jgi:hypothetical protein|nr:hypothetical protein [Acetivibrio thermocellus]UWV46297.1 hypothetical protein N1236_12065 [Acetivibrio thermocellus]
MVILIEDDFMFFGRHEDHYDFLIVLGKAEREKFEAVKHEFPLEIQQLMNVNAPCTMVNGC